jgi:putative membrane protein
MKKTIIIDSEAVVKEEKKEPIKTTSLIDNKLLEWLIYMIGYAFVLIIVSLLSSSLYIDLSYCGIYALLAAMIIYVLSKTIKPLLHLLMLPITILTMGLFYPVVNIIVLKLTSLLLGANHFNIKGFIGPFFVVIIITILNIFMDGFLKPFFKGKNNG